MSTIEKMVPSIYGVGVVHGENISLINYVTGTNNSKKDKLFYSTIIKKLLILQDERVSSWQNQIAIYMTNISTGENKLSIGKF